VVVVFQILVGDVGGLVAFGAEILKLSALSSFSREAEAAADAEGVRMMHAAGLDPLALARFFERLDEKHGDVPGAVAWLSSHPQNQARVAAIKAQAAALPPVESKPLDVDWAGLRQRLGIAPK
jgi:predicted Zn-dependent protease